MATIGMVNVGLLGHAAPAGRLAAVLASAGHRVVESWPDRSAGERGPPLDDFDAVSAGVARMTPGLCEATTQALMEQDVDLVVHDSMAPWGRIAAAWLGLPRVCSFAPFPAPAVTRELRVGKPRSEHVETLTRVRDEVVRRWGVELGGFSDVLVNAGDVTVAYTTPLVAGMEPGDPSWQLVGPLMGAAAEGEDDAGFGPDDGRPLVYVALGTFFNHRPELFRAPLEALAGEDVRVLLSTGGAQVASIGALPDNVTATSWVDSRAALRRAAVHVTHGGASSVHESLLEEVPMVCLPQGSDHFLWARRVAELGVGEVILEPDPAAIRDAVLRGLGDDGARRRARELAAHLRAYPGRAMVLDAVEGLLA